MAGLEIGGIDAVINGQPVVQPLGNLAVVNLADSVTGATGDGRYVVSLTSTGSFVVAKNPTGTQTNTTQVEIVSANVVGGTVIGTADLRPRGVSADAAALIFSHQPNMDGTYLNDKVVSKRALTGDVQLALGIVSSGTVFPTHTSTPPALDGQLFYRTDQHAFYFYDGPAATWIHLIDANTSGQSVTGSFSAGNLQATSGASAGSGLVLGSSTASTASAGSVTPPTQVLGYLVAYIGSTQIKIPYYGA